MAYPKNLDEYILALVRDHEILEQIELQQLLEKRGFTIPQATLSRRLKKLNIAKVSGIYKIVGLTTTHLPMVLKLTASESGLIVLHTNPGEANALAASLDKKYIHGPLADLNSPIIGSLAGDDTILLILKGPTYKNKALKLLKQDFSYQIWS